MGYERVKKRIEDELGDLPQWISDLDGGFYKQDETIEYATPISPVSYTHLRAHET